MSSIGNISGVNNLSYLQSTSLPPSVPAVILTAIAITAAAVSASRTS